MKRRMKKLKKLVVLLLIVFVAGGVFINSSFVTQKQAETYSQLVEKYGVSQTEVEEIKEEAKEEIKQEEQKQEQSIAAQAPIQEAVKDNRTVENIIWDFLKENGYSDIQTAAIIGNLYQESGLDSTKVEYGTKEGIGLVQWSFGRKQQLKKYCSDKGKDWTDLNCQLEFLVKELKSKQFYEPYKSTFDNPYSVDEAAQAYCFGFERPNKQKANMSYRVKMAWKAYYRNVNR